MISLQPSGSLPWWVVATGAALTAGHSTATSYFFLPVLADIAAACLWSAVDMDPTRNLAFWFLLSGFLMMLLGYVTDWMEARTPGSLPPALGWALLALLVTGGVTMPVSGFWLLIPVIYGCLRGGRRRAGGAGVQAAGSGA